MVKDEAHPDRLTVLRANAETLRRALELAEPQAVAALVRELRITAKEIEDAERDAPVEVSLSDQLAAARAAKVAAAADSASTGRRGQPRRRGGDHRAG